MILVFMMLAAGLQGNNDVELLKTFDPPTEDYLGMSMSMCFSPQGTLFVTDQTQFRILSWNADGSFKRGFGQQGEGPGEFASPVQILATADAVYVWEDRQKISVFGHDGVFKRAFNTLGARPRSFGVLNKDLMLLGFRSKSNEDMYMHFELRNGRGEVVREISKQKNEFFLKLRPGDNNARIRAFMPEVDVQLGPDGNWYYGFSQDRKMYSMDANGKSLGVKEFDLPIAKPSEKDREWFMNMSFPGNNGTRLTLKELPNIQVEFDMPKAFYTHFMIVGDKVAFVLTSIGSTDATNCGFNRASYYVCDFQTGKVLSRGSYAFPEDSAVYYQNGRALACVLNEDEEYEIHEVSLRGI